MSKNAVQRIIEVWADWAEFDQATLMGHLRVTPSRGKEVFAFEYADTWLAQGPVQVLDPTLRLYTGPQYAPADQDNFGIFLDSSPDRWGRVLMRRREAQLARSQRRSERRLVESDYLLGVHDSHRMGALRFRLAGGQDFLDNNPEMASPPWTSLRELEQVSLALEQDDAQNKPDYAHWLRMLIAPGGSLGGARPKASVLDNCRQLWIAKFPSRNDHDDVGAWEKVIHELARQAGMCTPAAQLKRFGSPHHTFLCKRFDRTPQGRRLHFASALTLLQRSDGDDAASGATYLELAEFLIQSGADTPADLEELWRRIVFNICVSNTDDHLRNHGFILTPSGWRLSPAYDMNPNPHGAGLKLNISETDNAQDIELARSVTPYFRVGTRQADAIINQVVGAVQQWRQIAVQVGLSGSQQELMAPAFDHASG